MMVAKNEPVSPPVERRWKNRFGKTVARFGCKKRVALRLWQFFAVAGSSHPKVHGTPVT
jgi:hypothetical protein